MRGREAPHPFLFYVGGLHREHGVYPMSMATDSRISCLLFRYEHPSLWYLLPVSVTYTVGS